MLGDRVTFVNDGSIIGVALGIACALGCVGCLATTDQLDVVTRQVSEYEVRLQAVEASHAAERDLLAQRLEEAQGVLDDASQVLRRNSADHGLRIDELEQQLAEVRGQIAEARDAADSNGRGVESLRAESREHRTQLDVEHQRLLGQLDEVARAAGMDVPARDDEIPAGADAHYAAADRALRAGEHSHARALMRAFLERYPTDARADDAQYLLGVSYLRQGQPSAALGELRRILTVHRTGDVVDRALLDMAEAFVLLGVCDDARDTLQTLVSTLPRSRLVPRARTRLRELARGGCPGP